MPDVYLADIKSKNRRGRPGFCVDSGAPSSVVGVKEVRRILDRAGKRMPSLRRSPMRFRFADAEFESLGQIELPLATPAGLPNIYVTLDVISSDIPALLGLNSMDEFSLTADTVTNRLVKRIIVGYEENGEPYAVDEWNVPLVRSHGHIYALMGFPSMTFFSRADLSKMHRQFRHPSADKLYKLLKRARPDEVSQATLRTLEDLAKSCDPCQRIQKGPKRFRVAFGAEDVRFNERILMDIVYLDSKPALHIVDDGTHFSHARFLPDLSSKTIWATFVECWVAVYTGLPHKILVDQGSNLGPLFTSIAAASNVQVDHTGVQAHSSLGIGERYHEPLRTTYHKLKLEFPNESPTLLLAISVKALNDTLGPEGLVPSALVFGEMPSTTLLGEPQHPRATVEHRAALAQSARKEMEHHMAKLRVQRALRHQVPPAADRTFEVGQQVLVWREKLIANRIGEWVGPFAVERIEEERKLVYIRDVPNRDARPYNFAQVKRYISPSNSIDRHMRDLEQALASYRSEHISDVFVTEIIDAKDPRAHSPEMKDARRKEVENLLSRGTFKVILREEIPPDGNVLPGRFVLAIKSTEDGNVKYKARYVIGGHRDKLKRLMVHSSQTLQPSSIRLLLALAAVHGFDIWTADVRQAYLQAAEPLMRDVYIRDSAPEFELDPAQCFQLLLPLYGLCESGDLWHKTLDDHHRNDLNMEAMRSDPALYALMVDGLLEGLSGTYVDDLMRCGKSEFRKRSKLTNDRFEMADDEELPCTFTGFQLQKTDDGTVQLNQDVYAKSLKPIPEDGTWKHFSSARMKLAWLSNSRPDCVFEVAQLAQVTVERFNEDPKHIIKWTNRVIKYASENLVSIQFPKLDMTSLQVIGFSDASFASNADLTSQLGYICFLGDATGAVIPVHFKSYKARRVTRSVMAAELIAFSDLFDSAYTLADELRHLHPTSTVPVKLFTDNKSLFDVISKGSKTAEKRLMLDIACAREGFLKHEISDIGFVRTKHNVSDGLTKRMQQEALRSVLRNGRLDVIVDQWIIRRGLGPNTSS